MSKHREVVLALKALVIAALPAADVKGFDRDTAKPSRQVAGGTVVGIPGEAGEAEVDLSPLTYHYQRPIRIEVAAPLGAADPDAAIDAMMGAIGAAVIADRSLGGVVDHLEAVAPDIEDAPVMGAETIRWAGFDLVASYATPDPLN